MIQELPTSIVRYIGEYLSYQERLRLPVPCTPWIARIRFPLRFPVQRDDLYHFRTWFFRRKSLLRESLRKVEYASILYYHPRERILFAEIIAEMSSFPHITSLTLKEVRPFYLLFDSVPVGIHMPVRAFLSQCLRMDHLHLDVPLLLHVNPRAVIRTLSIGFTLMGYMSSWGQSYTAITPVYPLKRLLASMADHGGTIEALYFSVLETKNVTRTFDFLFGFGCVLDRIHFQGISYSDDPILMMWEERGIRCTLATSYDMKQWNNKNDFPIDGS